MREVACASWSRKGEEGCDAKEDGEEEDEEEEEELEEVEDKEGIEDGVVAGGSFRCPLDSNSLVDEGEESCEDDEEGADRFCRVKEEVGEEVEDGVDEEDKTVFLEEEEEVEEDGNIDEGDEVRCGDSPGEDAEATSLRLAKTVLFSPPVHVST